MSRPDDIPEDVWDYVLFQVMPSDLIGSTLGNICHRAICRAILAERERCVRVAERMLGFADTTSEADKAIAAAIRAGGQ